MPDEHAVPRDGTARRFPRRRFLRDTALAGGSALVVGAAGLPAAVGAQATPGAEATPGAAAGVAAYTPVALTADEFATVAAIVARLIPADDLGPGAAEAGVPVYIDRVLAGADAASLPLYRQNLTALEAAALAQGGVFAALSPGDQDALLKRLEATQPTAEAAGTPPVPSQAGGRLTEGPIAGASPGFFALILEHTRQGMFGDPIYGGNANFVGWDLVGYPGIKLVWSPEEQAVGTVVKPEHVSVAKYGGSAR